MINTDISPIVYYLNWYEAIPITKGLFPFNSMKSAICSPFCTNQLAKVCLNEWKCNFVFFNFDKTTFVFEFVCAVYLH